MPATTYNVSNREEDKLRGRDQSFRNCVVTMFVFILLCVVIILATIPWRNTSLRHDNKNDEFDERDSPIAGKSSNKTDEARDKGVFENSPTLSTKMTHRTPRRKWSSPGYLTPRFIPQSTTEKMIGTTSTKIPEILTTARPTTTRSNIGNPTITIRDNSGTLSTTTPLTNAPSSTTARNSIETSSWKIWNTFKPSSTTINTSIEPPWTTTTRNIGKSSSTTEQSVGSSSKRIQNDGGTSTTMITRSIDPVWTTIRNGRRSSSTTEQVDESSSKKIVNGVGTSTSMIDRNIDSTWTPFWNVGKSSSTTEKIQNSGGTSMTLVNRNTDSTWTPSKNFGRSSTSTVTKTESSSAKIRNNDAVSSTTNNWNSNRLWTIFPRSDSKLSSTTQDTFDVSSRSTTVSNANIGPSRTTPRTLRPLLTTTANNDKTSSGEFQDNDGTSTTVSYNNIHPSTTTAKNIGSLSSTIQDNTKVSSAKIQPNVATASTLIDINTNALSSTTPEIEIDISNRIQNNAENSGELQDNFETSPTPQRHLTAASTIITDNTETSSETYNENTFPSSSSSDQDVTFSSNTDETSIESSLGIESTSFSSSIGIKLLNTDESGFFYTEETAESSIASPTPSSSDIPSINEESTSISESSSTTSENPKESSGKKTTNEKDDRFPSLKTLVVSTFHRNISNISVTEMNSDWLEDFDSMTTSNDGKNYTEEFERIFSAATMAAAHHPVSSMIKDLQSQTGIETATTIKINTDEDEYQTTVQNSSDDNYDGTTININTDETKMQSTSEPQDPVTVDLPEEKKNTTDEVCLSGKCKQFASRIVSYMNHSADPCEDFYEYACGGLEADPQMNGRNLADQAYNRIKRQLKKSKEASEFSGFKNYYNSCVKYYQETTQDEKILQAREMLVNIGHLYTNNVSNPRITQLLAYMILHDNPLLFDIVPDINERDPQKFILRIGPVVDNKSPLRDFEADTCIIEDDEFSSESIDMETLYQDYEKCKDIERHTLQSVKSTMKIFHISNRTDSTLEEPENTEEIVMQIDRQVSEVLANYPRVSEIHASYKSKKYTVMTIGALQEQITFINWTELIHTVTGGNVTSNTKVQIYLKDHLIEVLKNLESFGELHEIHNALLWLYARKLHEQFVKPKTFEYSEKQCLHIAMNYLPDEATHLYLSSFNEMQIDFMSSMINRVFINLKETLKLKFERIKWAPQSHLDILFEQIANTQLSNPKNLYLKSILNINMTDNFFDNTVMLMKRLRADMYRIMNKIPSDPELLWTYFAKPFQSYGQVIHKLNIILIPFGAVDSSQMMQTDSNFDYLTFATIGNLIARELAHYLDRDGFTYSAFALHQDNSSTYDPYFSCNSTDYLFGKPINMILPASNKHIRIMIPPTTINERHSDIVGVRLAYETLARMESNSSKLLPWLDSNIHKLFYLAYAQTYCTKVPLTSSYVSLYENSVTPSRLRILATAMNDKVLSELWNCRGGSSVPSYFTCEASSEFDYQNVPIGSN